MGILLTQILLGRKYRSDEDRDVKIQYSILLLIDKVEKYLIILGLFSMLGHVDIAIIIGLTIELTRNYLGGIHMKTWYGCTAVTVLFCIVVLACGENIILSSKLQNSLWVAEIVVIALFAPIPSKQRPKYNQHRKNMIKARGIAGVLIIGAVSLAVKSYNNYIVWIWLLQIIEVMISKLSSLIKRNK